MNEKLKIAILGASGYTGAELVRLLSQHQFADIKALGASSNAGKELAEIFPHLSTLNLPVLQKTEEIDFSNIDFVFCALPHGTTQKIISVLPSHLKIVDLSADFRLFNPDTYSQHYGHEHYAPELQKQAVYGLCENNRETIAKARLVANPGCYPTSVELPLIPLLKKKLIDEKNIIIDSKSGTSGAGRGIKEGSLFCEVNEGIHAYAIASHRHTPEIEQELSTAFGADIKISFTPHLMPMTRGMLTTIYAKTENDISSLRDELCKAYENEPFIKILPRKDTPHTHHAKGSNNCLISVFKGSLDKQVIIVSAIDNLVKGASGQAIQNMNIMCGFPETEGLKQIALFP